uniref:Lipoprotein signal peptidase n=1 Tax=Desulfomonile tiedjei TaxID=2358 RepID=A0A7C4AS16_9BACT
MRKKYWVFSLISASAIILDQATKWLATRCIPLNESVAVVHFVNMVHVRNPGAAFGIMSQNSGAFQWTLLVLISVAALLIVLWLVARSDAIDGYILTAYAFFFAGAAGNLIDRLRYGEVVDFIDVYAGKYHWPAFNVADAVLCIGAGLLLLHSLRGGMRAPEQ